MPPLQRFLHANWNSGNWSYSGNESVASVDAGQLTSSATGTYEHDETDGLSNSVPVDGSMGVTSLVNWGYNATVTLNPNTSDSLTMSSGAQDAGIRYSQMRSPCLFRRQTLPAFVVSSPRGYTRLPLNQSKEIHAGN